MSFLTLFQEGPWISEEGHGVAAAAREGTKHKNRQVLIYSVVHDVVLYVHCKDSVCFGGLWDVTTCRSRHHHQQQKQAVCEENDTEK